MFGKHFESTYTGSMMGAGALVFAVWGYVISHTRQSKVELNPKLLSLLIGEPEEAIKNTIAKLCEPDPNSRTKDYDGRRLIRQGEFEYEVVNYEKYRRLGSVDERREYHRNYWNSKRSKATQQDSTHSTDSTPQKQKQKQKQKHTHNSDFGVEFIEKPLPKHVASQEFEDMKRRVNRMFQRTEEDHWTHEEHYLLSLVCQRPNYATELDEIQKIKRMQPKSVQSLLERWGKHLDRSRVDANGKEHHGMSIKQQIDALKAAIEVHAGNPESTSYVSPCPPEKRDEFRAMVAKVGKLQSQLAAQVMAQ